MTPHGSAEQPPGEKNDLALLERVARAMFMGLVQRRGWLPNGIDWDTQDEEVQREWIDQARAALGVIADWLLNDETAPGSISDLIAVLEEMS